MLRNLSSRTGSLLSAGLYGQARVALRPRLPSSIVSRRLFGAEISASWPDSIRRFLEREQIISPTVIQKETLPVILKEKDLVGVARTGSGKTLAFAIPAIMKILEQHEPSPSGRLAHKDVKATVLVIAPTRELASQTAEVFTKFSHLGIKTLPLVGGTQRNQQTYELTRSKHHVYVGTPGRLVDLHESGLLDLSQINYLVLDEADRMLEMGFEDQLKRILGAIPEKRQTLLWSATWPQEIEELAQQYLQDYERITIDSDELKANPNIKQEIIVCQATKKMDILLETLHNIKSDNPKAKILIFGNTKSRVNAITLKLMQNRHHVASMHGDKTQHQRTASLNLFKSGRTNILAATDVASRGLDISDITHVINFDFPNTIEDYIHRIGRTARYERSGNSVTLISELESSLAKKLIDVLKETEQDIPDELHEFAKQGREPAGRSFSRYNHVRRFSSDFEDRGRGYRKHRGSYQF